MSRQRIFIFKQFRVSHSASAMKVGVDGVLAGAWVRLPDVGRVLDAGSGCGLIALMCAQRNCAVEIDAVDCDPGSAAEASANYLASPWADRIRQLTGDWTDTQCRYDLIVSNPPFFESGIAAPDTARLISRHAATLSPRTLLRNAPRMLAPGGSLAMISPYDGLNSLLAEADVSGMYLHRLCKVKDHPGTPIKRILTQWAMTEPQQVEYEILTLHNADGFPTEDYKKLCSGFYSKEKY